MPSVAVILDRIFGGWVLLGVNLFLIAAVELFGEGKWFLDTGLIHAIAVFFIVLAISRIFLHYYPFDTVLEKFVHACLAALVVFAASHFVEFLSYSVFSLSWGVVFANVGNFYIASLLLVIVGAEFFLRLLYGRSVIYLSLLTVIVLVPIVFSAVLFYNPSFLALFLEGPVLYLYPILIILITAVGLHRLRAIQRHTSFTKDFIDYFMVAFVLVALSALQNFLYVPLENAFGIPIYQTVYVSHFLFYAALSMMFFSFSRIK